MKREAKLKGGFYVDPEAKLIFIIRIRGYALKKLFISVDTYTLSYQYAGSDHSCSLWNFQYQCYAPKDKNDLAAVAIEAG